MAVYALTGDLSSGKSTILTLLKNKGAIVFDIDEKIHECYKEKQGIVYKNVINLFPEVLADGEINRKKLGDVVFNDLSELKVLEDIVHPFVLEEMFRWIESVKSINKVCVAEVPLLFEKGLIGYFEDIILVTVKQEELIQRIIKKYNLSKEQVLDRLALYLPVEEKKEKTSFIIDNSFDFEILEKEVNLLWQKITIN